MKLLDLMYRIKKLVKEKPEILNFTVMNTDDVNQKKPDEPVLCILDDTLFLSNDKGKNTEDDTN